jgi:hypothetical protein
MLTENYFTLLFPFFYSDEKLRCRQRFPNRKRSCLWNKNSTTRKCCSTEMALPVESLTAVSSKCSSDFFVNILPFTSYSQFSKLVIIEDLCYGRHGCCRSVVTPPVESSIRITSKWFLGIICPSQAVQVLFMLYACLFTIVT